MIFVLSWIVACLIGWAFCDQFKITELWGKLIVYVMSGLVIGAISTIMFG